MPTGCVKTIGGYTDVPSLGCLAETITRLVEVALMFAGIVTLLVLFWGAIRFITSRGDPKGIQQAQKTLTYAIIGVAVVLSSFIIVNVVTAALNLPNILTNFSFSQP